MAEFLTDAWIAELDRVAQGASAPFDLRLVIQQVVLEARGVERCYAVRVEDGRVSIAPGRAQDADLTLTQDRATAAAIARGELSAQVAFMAGELRVGGDLRLVLERAGALAALGDVFAAARNSTTW